MKIKYVFNILINNGGCIPIEKIPLALFFCASQNHTRLFFLNNEKELMFKGVCI